MTMTLTRRSLIAGAASLPLMAGLARAEASMLGVARAAHRRFRLGAFEVTVLLAGQFNGPDPHSIFGLNVPEEEFDTVSAAHFISSERLRLSFAPVLVNTGEELILFDTGTSAQGLIGALRRAGYEPEQVDKVVITHMHGDHIGGLMGDGGPSFANASYVTGRVEYDHWAEAGNSGFDDNMRPLAEQTRFLEPGEDAAPGVTAIEAFGHTPGHMAYHIESGSARLMLFADLANHPVWSLAHPNWEVRFDMDKEAAATSRRRVLDMLATERIPAIGYHMPFPATGFVARREGGFAWVPESGQLG